MNKDLQRPRPEATNVIRRREGGFRRGEAREPVGGSLFVAVILLSLLLALV